jgi:hypothetical protein
MFNGLQTQETITVFRKCEARLGQERVEVPPPHPPTLPDQDTTTT